MNPRELPAKIAAAEKAGDRGLARHLRRAARMEGVPAPAPEPRAARLPALPFSAGDLSGLGIPWTRDGGRLEIIVPVRGGGKP
ncbi:MAG: hypothetical protein F4Y47_00180 [Acidobacteriia bacterium]|nr:hypothetical protein [Terriglobia bacterium]MYG04419.1 hypothetical protein [Terriglobia bacterium]MYK11284.1 hypothetical protein [Terriglobia bacterium]